MNSKTEEFSQKVKGKYTPSEIKKFMTQEDIDQYATEDEKAFLKEDYLDLINPAGHADCPKCGSKPRVGSSSHGKMGRRNYHIGCSNYGCGVTSHGFYESPMYHNVTAASRQEKAIHEAWDSWDSGDVIDWHKITGKE